MRFNFQNAVLPLIVINVILFIVQIAFNGFTEIFMLVSGDIFTRPWILVTSMFLHGSPGHLIFNMYALLLFGTLIEQKIGTKRFLMIYFASGILASLGFAFFYEVLLKTSASAVGASGGMMGILGITIMLLPNLRVLLFFVIPMSMRTAGILFAIIDLLGIFGIGVPGIANSAHLVGLACGVGYGVYLLKQKKHFAKRFVPRQHHRIERAGYYKDPNKSMELSKKEAEDYLRFGKL
jgi:membrane associated rhomboid family serine protease